MAKRISLDIDSAEFEEAQQIAQKDLKIDLSEFATRCVKKLLRLKPKEFKASKAEPRLKAESITPSSLRSDAWAEAIAVAQKRLANGVVLRKGKS